MCLSMVLGISIHQIPLRISSKQSSDTRRQNGERYTILGSWWCNTSDPQVKTFTNRPSVSWSRSYCSLMIYWKGNKKWLKEEKYTQNKRKKKNMRKGKKKQFQFPSFPATAEVEDWVQLKMALPCASQYCSKDFSTQMGQDLEVYRMFIL